MADIKITVLTDNIPHGDLEAEWGLSFLIDYKGKKYLLDTGASGKFITNARKLGLDIADVDCAVLSHAHYDHALGMEEFFKANEKALFYMSGNARENCYAKILFFKKYVGIERGILERRKDRIAFCSGVHRLDDGVWTVQHSTPGLDIIGKKSHMYALMNGRLIPDDFSHEHTLVFETAKGLVVMNSCSHAGAEVIISEVRKAFPGKDIAAFVGGMHLSMSSGSDVEDVAERIKSTGISKVITGHCTGDKAFKILKERLGDAVSQFHTGMTMEF